jgi:hypothetical protein
VEATEIMKTFIATVALATLIAAPAFAQAPSTNTQPPGVTNPNAVVAPGGKIIGVDPDPNIRFEILRDVSKPYK